MPPSSEGPRTPDDGASDPLDTGFERESGVVRSLSDQPIEMLDAPPGVWAGIEAAVAEDEKAADRPRLIRPGELAAGPAAQPEAPVVLSERRRPTRWLLAGAAAVVLVVAGVLVAVTQAGDTAEIAAAELRPVNGIDVGAAHAEVRLERHDGTLRLQVDMEGLPLPQDGTFYELWLLSDAGDPVSLAEMKDPSPDVETAVELPEGTDTDRYDVVDVSIQQDGAGPEHSGESILRGRLRA